MCGKKQKRISTAFDFVSECVISFFSRHIDFLKFVVSSVSGTAVDFVLFYALSKLLVALPQTVMIFVATAFSRVFAGFVNFWLNKKWSFKSSGGAGREMFRYFVLFFAKMAASAGGVSLLSRTVLPVMAAKAIVDSLLFFISYVIQLKWVFKTDGNHKLNGMKMKYKAIIFDLDGTLLDTLEDLAAALNFALSEHGFPVRTLDEVRTFVGNGMKKLIERGCPSGTPNDVQKEILATFKNFYAVHSADKTKPYDNILPMLDELKKSGIKLAVVSNKDDGATKVLCENYFPGIFDEVIGVREGIAKKPAPDSVFEVLEKFNCDKSSSIYIGDSEVDIETAKNACVPCISVTWGFRSETFLRDAGAVKIACDAKELFSFLI